MSCWVIISLEQAETALSQRFPWKLLRHDQAMAMPMEHPFRAIATESYVCAVLNQCQERGVVSASTVRARQRHGSALKRFELYNAQHS